MKPTRGRPKGEPTEQARLSPDQLRMLRGIADHRGVTIRQVLQSLAGKSIERAYRRILAARQPDLGGEAGGA